MLCNGYAINSVQKLITYPLFLRCSIILHTESIGIEKWFAGKVTWIRDYTFKLRILRANDWTKQAKEISLKLSE